MQIVNKFIELETQITAREFKAIAHPPATALLYATRNL